MYGMALWLFSSNSGVFGGVISPLCYLAVSVTVALAAYLPETTQGAARLGLSGAWHDGGYPARHFAFWRTSPGSAPVIRAVVRGAVLLSVKLPGFICEEAFHLMSN